MDPIPAQIPHIPVALIVRVKGQRYAPPRRPPSNTLTNASLARANGACADGSSWAAGLELPDAAIRELDALAARLKAKGLVSSETERRSGSWLSAGVVVDVTEEEEKIMTNTCSNAGL